MSNGPIATFVVGTADVSAPGSPIFGSFRQTSNVAGEVDVQLPSVDADGTPITGLKHLTVAAVLGSDPLAGMTPDEILASGAAAQAVALTDADAGTVKTLAVPILSAGATQTFYAWCDDNA